MSTCASLLEELLTSLRSDQETVGMLQAMNNDGHILISWRAEDDEKCCVRKIWDKMDGSWWSKRTKNTVQQICSAVCLEIANGTSREETKICDIISELLRYNAWQEYAI
jgi:hypothetical protein